MATATGSITDSAAQDDIPEKAHHLKASQAHVWAKEKLCPGFSQWQWHIVSWSQTLTRKTGESLVTLAYELVLIGHGISVGDN